MGFVSVSIVHSSGTLGPLLAQPATAPAGRLAHGAGHADAIATAPDLAALQRRIQSVVKAALPSVVSISSDSAARDSRRHLA